MRQLSKRVRSQLTDNGQMLMDHSKFYFFNFILCKHTEVAREKRDTGICRMYAASPKRHFFFLLSVFPPKDLGSEVIKRVGFYNKLAPPLLVI